MSSFGKRTEIQSSRRQRKITHPRKFQDFYDISELDDLQNDDIMSTLCKPKHSRPPEEHTSAGSGDSRPSDSAAKTFSHCGVCNKKFFNMDRMKLHMATHILGEDAHTCKVEGCGRTFSSKYTLTKHGLIHQGTKPTFPCPICDRSFSSKAALQEHEARHTDQHPLECSVCYRKFRQTSCLSRHMVTHSTDDPRYSCQFCGQMFKMATYLRSHLKSHTGEKPHKCSLCEKCFAHKSDLTRHHRTHTGEKRYSCDICSAKFTDISSKSRHMKRHSMRSNHWCEQCHMTFLQANQLAAHMAREHSVRREQSTRRLNNETKLTNVTDSLRRRFENETETLDNYAAVRSNISTKRKDNIRILRRNKKPILSNENDSGMTANDSGTILESDKTTNKCEISNVTKSTTSNAVHMSSNVNMNNNDDSNVTEIRIDENTVIHHVDEQGQLIAVESLSGNVEENAVIKMLIDQGDAIIVVDEKNSHGKNQGNRDDNLDSYNVGDSSNSSDCGKMGNITDTISYEESRNTGCESEKSVGNSNVTTNNLLTSSDNSFGKELTMSPTDEITGIHSIDYVKNPDFHSPIYLNWLSNFAQSCQKEKIPLTEDVYHQISEITQSVANAMFTRIGLLKTADNYRLMMDVMQILSRVMFGHMNCVLEEDDTQADDVYHCT